MLFAQMIFKYGYSLIEIGFGGHEYTSILIFVVVIVFVL